MTYKKNHLLLYFFLLFSFNLIGQNDGDPPTGTNFLCYDNTSGEFTPIPPQDRSELLLSAKTELSLHVTSMSSQELAAFKTEMFALLSTQEGDGGWNDINYDDDFPVEHLERLVKLSIAYALDFTLADDYTEYLPEAIGEKIVLGIAYWYCEVPLISGTWFDDEIARQRELQKIGILLSDTNDPMDVPFPLSNCSYTTLPTVKRNLIENLPFNNFEPYDDGETEAYTGANKADIASSIIARGLIDNKLAVFKEGICVMQSAMNYVPLQEGAQHHEDAADQYEGIQRDNSFHQHKRLLYTGGYGHSFITRVSFWGAVLHATDYDFTHKDNFFDYILEGCRWMIRGNTTDYSASGRYLTRSHPEYNNAINNEDMVRVLTMATGNDNLAKLEEMQANSVDGLAQAITGNKFFWKSDYVSHHHANYFSSVKMCSDRTIGTENVESTNEFGYWLPYGCTYIYLNGDEYRDIFMDDNFDWEKIPGVTCPEDLPSDFEDGSPTKRSTLNKVYFVGATTNKSFEDTALEPAAYGVSAMNFNKAYDESQLAARKAWFHFGDEIIALGGGIHSDYSGANLATTINQCLLGNGSTHRDGIVINEGESTTETSWIHHNNVGYIFPETPKVTLKTEDELFLAWIDHGMPADAYASYYYMIIPGMTVEEATSYDPANEVEVMHNEFVDQDEKQFIQAIKKDNLVGIVFYPETEATFIEHNCDEDIAPELYESSSFSSLISHQVIVEDDGNGNTISFATDKPCILFYDGEYVCISSPDRSHQTINLFITRSNPASSLTQTFSFDLAQGDLEGLSTCQLVNNVIHIDCPTVAATGDDGNLPINTLDGSLETWWSNANDGGTIEYCLEEITELSCIEIAFTEAVGNATFTVEIYNGTGWTPVITDQSPANIGALYQYTFPLIVTERIRIFGNNIAEVNWENCNFPENCQQLFYEDFDTGSGTYWTCLIDEDDCDINKEENRSFSPEYCARIWNMDNDGLALVSSPLGETEIDAVTVEFTFLTRRFKEINETNGVADRIILEIAPEGDNFESIGAEGVWTVGNDFCEGQRVFASVCLADFPFSAATRFRLRSEAPTEADGDEHRAYIDDIEILNCRTCNEEEPTNCYVNCLSAYCLTYIDTSDIGGVITPGNIFLWFDCAIEDASWFLNGTALPIDFNPEEIYQAGEYCYRYTDMDGCIGENCFDIINADYSVMICTGGGGDGDGDACYDIIAQNDDAEEFGGGDVDLGSSDLDLGKFLAGLRFETNIPANATITNAFIRFTASDDDSSRGVMLNITGADPDGLSASSNQAPFEDIPYNISSRSVVADINGDIEVAWETGEWVDNESYDTPDISAIVQAIVNSPGYATEPFSNSMVFKISKSINGRAVEAQTFGDESIPAKLCVEYRLDAGARDKEVKLEIPIKDSDEFMVSVRPNPSSGLFNIDFDEALTSISQATVFSADGQIKYSTLVTVGEKNMTINAKAWPAGIYFLKVKSGDKQSIIRLVKI